MNKFSIASLVISMLIVSNLLSAQTTQIPFFDSKGSVRIETTELDALADTIAVINHRTDDVVWSHIVYRVIDMREKQNYQLYFPTRANEEYRSLFRVMLDAICSGVNVYKKNPRDLKPSFKDKLEGEELSKAFAFDNDMENNLLQINPVTQQRTVSIDQYARYVRNQLKYLVQEIVFFDKHTSRMYSKIIAIAPLYALHHLLHLDALAWCLVHIQTSWPILALDLFPFPAPALLLNEAGAYNALLPTLDYSTKLIKRLTHCR